jgi:hypothetical protein
MILTYTYRGINRSFSSHLRLSMIFYYPANGNWSLARIIEVVLYLRILKNHTYCSVKLMALRLLKQYQRFHSSTDCVFFIMFTEHAGLTKQTMHTDHKNDRKLWHIPNSLSSPTCLLICKTCENTDHLQCMLKLYYLNGIKMPSFRRNSVIKLQFTTIIWTCRQKKREKMPFFGWKLKKHNTKPFGIDLQN